MSEGIVIALIGFAGAVFGAIIASATSVLVASLIRKDDHSLNLGQLSTASCAVFVLLAAVGGTVGLAAGAFFGSELVQPAKPTVETQAVQQNPPYAAPTQTSPPGVSQSQIATPFIINTNAPQCQSSIPSGLIEIAKQTNPRWSNGIWVSSNVLNFTTETIGVINSNAGGFGNFEIWIDPCETARHGYVPPTRFWRLGGTFNESVIVPIGGNNATTISIPPNTGNWALGREE